MAERESRANRVRALGELLDWLLAQKPGGTVSFKVSKCPDEDFYVELHVAVDDEPRGIYHVGYSSGPSLVPRVADALTSLANAEGRRYG